MPARWAQISLVLGTSGTSGIATETPTGPWGDCREAAAGGLAHSCASWVSSEDPNEQWMLSGVAQR